MTGRYLVVYSTLRTILLMTGTTLGLNDPAGLDGIMVGIAAGLVRLAAAFDLPAGSHRHHRFDPSQVEALLFDHGADALQSLKIRL